MVILSCRPQKQLSQLALLLGNVNLHELLMTIKCGLELDGLYTFVGLVQSFAGSHAIRLLLEVCAPHWSQVLRASIQAASEAISAKLRSTPSHATFCLIFVLF